MFAFCVHTRPLHWHVLAKTHLHTEVFKTTNFIAYLDTWVVFGRLACVFVGISSENEALLAVLVGRLLTGLIGAEFMTSGLS